MSSDQLYLHRTLYLANKRLGFCAPNPAVGALVVKAGQELGAGWHHAAGEVHAEVMALESAGHCEGATLYVSLEPCCHFGRTPPCTDLIIRKKIARVVYAHHDPDQRVAGQGCAQLQAAGIQCEYQPQAAAATFYQAYDQWQLTHQPLFTAKLAMSLNGKIAGPNGARMQLTGRSAQRYTHAHRYHADAILTTANTILADNPRLDVRFNQQTIKKTLIVLDRQGRLTGNEQIWQTASKVILLQGEKVMKDYPAAQVLSLPEKDGYFDLNAMKRCLGKLGFHHIWIEAGGQFTQNMLLQGLLYRFILLIAPRWVEDGMDAFTLNCLRDIRAVVKWRSCGRDGLGEFLLK